MGEEDVCSNGDNENRKYLRIKLTRCGPRWIPEVIAREACSKKLAKQRLEEVKELENSLGPEERLQEVSDPSISPKENTLCSQPPMSKFKLKRSGDKWSSEVTARELCAKKQASTTVVSTGPGPHLSDFVRKQKTYRVGCTKKRKRVTELHQLLFLPKGLQDGTKLEYIVKKESMLKGYKQGSGIVCSCCDTEISPSDFEAHAKCDHKRQPYRYIRTTNGHTLHEIALWLSNGQTIQSIIPSSTDDKCVVCGAELEGIPTGERHCSRCTENTGPNGKDSSPFISQPDPVVKQPVYQPGGCFICRAQDLSVDTFDEMQIVQCYQCGKQYHVKCLLGIGLCDLKELPMDKWFCCHDCNSIYSTMQGLLKENKVLLASGLDKHIGKGLTDVAGNVIHWKILSGTNGSLKDSRLLSKASSIFKECFKTIKSETCDDLIAAAVNGKNISEQESRQIYYVVLIVDSVVSSAAVLRIISREIAELPVVATPKIYRGNGYFRTLFSCIEQLLVSINVEKIVLSAAKETESIWTNKLGFKRISDEQLLEYTKDFQLTLVSETMLEKVLQEAACKSKVVQTTS